MSSICCATRSPTCCRTSLARPVTCGCHRIEPMFGEDLGALPTRDLLEQAAGCRTTANQADVRLLECAQLYADRHHPATCTPRPGRRASDGRERAVVLGGDGCPEIA